ASSFCSGNTITLSDAAPGGSWSSSGTSIAAVGTNGIVSGVAAGLVTISYAVTNICGTVFATQAVTVNPLPVAAAISGLSSVCVGASITLSDPATGGSWSARNGHAAITGSGAVYGVASGIDTLVYAVTNSCGTATATKTITVNPLPDAGAITGPTAVCE